MGIARQEIEQLYRSSIVVTGAHYAMTTLVGLILAVSPEFEYVRELFEWNMRIRLPTIVVDGWYPYYTGRGYERFREELMAVIAGQGIVGGVMQRLPLLRSPRDVGRLGGYTFEQARRRRRPRPAIFKEPFMALTAPSLQKGDGLRTVVCMRHPCAWVESAVRRDDGFDISHFDRPRVLDALPEFADDIVRMSRQGGAPLDRAILAWRVLYTHHAQHLLDDPRTLLCRLKDFVADPRGQAERLFAFAGVPVPEGLDARLAQSFSLFGHVDRYNGPDYTHRNGEAVLNKWRTRLGAEDVARIRRATEELAERFGYTPQDW